VAVTGRTAVAVTGRTITELQIFIETISADFLPCVFISEMLDFVI